MTPNPDRIIKQGVWLYAGEVTRRVVIVEDDVFPGSGDYEDPPEVANDRHLTCFAVWFETDIAIFGAGGGWFESLSDAVAHVERVTNQSVIWLPAPSSQP